MANVNRDRKPRTITIPDELMKVFKNQFGETKTFSGWVCEKLHELSSSVAREVQDREMIERWRETVNVVSIEAVKESEKIFQENMEKYADSEEGIPVPINVGATFKRILEAEKQEIENRKRRALEEKIRVFVAELLKSND